MKLQRLSFLHFCIIGVAAFGGLLLWPGLLANFFATQGYDPHGQSYLWEPRLVSLSVISDSLIGLSYVTISATMAYFAYRVRRDIPFNWVFLAFGSFAIACGGTHFMDVLTVWIPVYWSSGYVRLITALASVSTALMLPQILPRVFALIERAKLSEKYQRQLLTNNQQLETEINERRRVEQALQESHDDLERRVQQRTAELAQANETLQADAIRRQQATEVLRRSEARFRILVETMPGAIVVVGHNGRIVLMNKRVETVFGYTLEELTDQSIETLLPERFHSMHNTHFNGYFANPSTRPMDIGRDLAGRRKDGTEFPVEIGLSHTLTEDGLLTLAFITDITERKRAEGERRLLAAIVESSGDAIIGKTADGVITSWNRGAEKLYGYIAKEALGKSISILIPFDHPDDFPTIMSELRKGKSVEHYETIRQRKDGARLAVSLTISPIIDSGGKMIGASAIARDITERKRLEEELLTTERLRVELEKEKELSDLKDRFTSMVSHEFRTPLTVIKVSSELLAHYRDRFSPERQALYQQQILDQCDYMVELLEDVLTLSKGQVGKTAFNPMKLNVKTFCHALTESLQLTDTAHHEFVFDYSSSQEEANLDEHLLQHIFVNLLSNAIKYSPQGGLIRFDITQDTGDLVFRVSDQGLGIPVADQPRLFEAFHRAKNCTHIQGTGLGLSIVKQNVEIHQGTITFESQEGKGTTFIVRLPTSPTRG